jgi:hypothetical protein
MVDLDGTVDEVKQQIRDAEDPDYRQLLEDEKEGKDRKTVKEFLQDRIDDDEEEIEEEVEEELVEEIEEETEGGLLSGYSPQQVLTGGILGGLVIGILVALAGVQTGMVPTDGGISQVQAEDRVTTLLTAGGQISEDQVTLDTTRRNGMFYMNVTAEVEGVNGTTRSQSQSYYMSNDGQLLFPEVIRSAFGAQQVAIDVDRAIQQAQQPAPEPEPPANTSQPSGNTTQ